MPVNEKRLVKNFIEFVKIDSPSGQEKKFRNALEKKLNGMGVKTSRDHFGNLYATVSGKGNPFLLETHMDTVQPGENIKPIIKKNRIVSDGKTILGADDKAGIAEILELLQVLKENKIEHRPLELLFTCQEENGLDGAFHVNFKKLKAREGFVVDNVGPPMKICIAAPFITHIDATFHGLTAHAGVEPEKGISAIAIAGEVISKLQWGRIDKETTCNAGLIQGGTGRNVIPEMAEIKIETRSHDKKKMQKLNKKIHTFFRDIAKKHGAKISFKKEDVCPGYKLSTSDPLIKEISSVAKKMKLPVTYEKSGGASDANVFSGKNIKVVDISAGYQNCHTIKEFVNVKDMVSVTEFLLEFVRNDN